jgi:hypothetical protein
MIIADKARKPTIRVEHLKVTLLGKALALLTDIGLNPAGLPGDVIKLKCVVQQ